MTLGTRPCNMLMPRPMTMQDDQDEQNQASGDGMDIMHFLNISLIFLILSYNIIQYHTISYNIIQYHTISYNIIQYHTISYNIIQYQYLLTHHSIQQIDHDQ